MSAESRPPRIGSLANLLGIARIAATPVVIALMFVGSDWLDAAKYPTIKFTISSIRSASMRALPAVSMCGGLRWCSIW